MKFTIPPKLDALRRQVVRSHNRRVMLLLLGVAAIIAMVVAVEIPAQSNQTEMLIIGGVAALAEIIGIIVIIRLSKKQSIALGYACPLCGGALYDGRSNRLGNRGECPCCKKFILEKLNETAR